MSKHICTVSVSTMTDHPVDVDLDPIASASIHNDERVTTYCLYATSSSVRRIQAVIEREAQRYSGLIRHSKRYNLCVPRFDHTATELSAWPGKEIPLVVATIIRPGRTQSHEYFQPSLASVRRLARFQQEIANQYPYERQS